MPPLHDDELPIDADLVRRLVRQALPEHAHLTVEALRSSGSSNALFRLGPDLLVRLPRQPGGSTTIEKEARWLPVVGPGLTAAVPDVVAVGEPGFGYPERWAVTTWIEGRTPAVPSPSARDVAAAPDLAGDLARLVAELGRLEVPAAAYEDPALVSYRGGRLADVDEDFRESVEECRAIADLGLDLDAALRVWDDVLAHERVAPPRRWFHGDLFAENLLVRDGRLAAVLDFGGLGVGDPAVDLAVAWEVLDRAGREAFRRSLDVDDATWAAGAGWALVIAMITFPYYGRSMPGRCAARRSMAAAVLGAW